jgi:hypothetical protein
MNRPFSLALDPQLRRPILAVAGLALIAAIVIGAAAAIGSVADERTAAADAAEATLADLAARVRDRSPATARAERLLAGDPFLLETTATLAANALQRRLAALAGESGMALRSIGREEGRELGYEGLVPTALKLEAETTIAGLQTFLHRLETGTPFVLVDEVRVRPTEREGEAVGRRLAVELVVVGFRHRGAGG